MKWCALAALLVTLAGLASFTPARAPAPRPRPSDPVTERLLEMVFGKDEPLLRDTPIRFVNGPQAGDKEGRRAVFATRKVSFEGHGRVCLEPTVVVWFRLKEGALVPHLSATSPDKTWLTFDRPVTRLADLPTVQLLSFQYGNLILRGKGKR